MIPLVILADRLNQQERFDALKQWTGKSDSSFVTGLIWLGLGVMVLVGLLAIISAILTKRSRKAPRDPHKLFRQATIHLGLDLADRQLLLRIITDRRIEHPVTLLMSPQAFDAHADAWLKTLTADEAARKRRHLDDIRKAAFASADWDRVKEPRRSHAAPPAVKR